MYLRFETFRKNEDSSSNSGIFQAAIALRDSGTLKPYEQELLEVQYDWLRKHLKSPKCLREEHNFRAICWFHPRAKKPIEKVRMIAELIKDSGVPIQMRKTKDPGIIIYEDGWQVVAKPRKRSSRSKSAPSRC